MLPITFVHTKTYELFVHVFLYEVLTREIHHRTSIASLVDDEERGDSSVFCHLGVISTKGRCDMHDTRTILGGHIITWNDTESFVFFYHHLIVLQCARLHPRHQLLVVQAHEVCALASPKDFDRLLVAFLVLLCCKICRQACLCQNVDGFLFGVWILAFDSHIVNLWTNTERSVGWKCPRRGCPCEDVNRAPLVFPKGG